MSYFKYNSTITTVNTIAFAVAEMVEKQKSDDKTLNLFGSKIKEKADAQSIAIKKTACTQGSTFWIHKGTRFGRRQSTL